MDVAIERSFLGFGGDKEPENSPSGKEQKRRILKLKEACQAAIADQLTPQLREAIAAQIADDGSWDMTFDPADRDKQTLLFQYPPAVTAELSPYFAASVKIELGARSDHFPVETAVVTPYLSDAFPDALTKNAARVRVLGAERTFWERATILHSLYHLPSDKHIAPRMSRHYYDVFRMSQQPVVETALGNMDLLNRVAVHKSVFFKSAWANYDQARAGTFRLVPRDRVHRELRRDFAAMQPMFFQEPPDFDRIIDGLRELEARVNARDD